MIYRRAYTDDLYQEVLVNIWRGLKGFKGKSQLFSWLYRITLNTAITFNKREQRHQHLEESSIPTQVQQVNENEDPRIAQLHQAIHDLPEPDRTLMSLVLEDFSYKEIAEILDWSVSNVGARIHRTKAKLNRLLNKEQV